MQKYKDSIIYIVFILIFFIWTVVSLKPKITDLITVENDLRAKTVESADLDRKLEALKASEVERTVDSGQIKNIYKPDAPGLDAESSFTVIFDDIIDMAKYNSVKIYSIEYIYNPPEDEFVKAAAAQYNVCELKISLISDYQDLESFLKELYKYPYLINIDKVELTPYVKNKRLLLTNMQIKLYATK